MELSGTLAPLIIGSALVPIQIVVTILLVRSPHGVRTAGAWVAGMATFKLIQGLLFGFVFGSSTLESDEAPQGPGIAVSVLLLVVAIIFYVTALKQLLAKSDPDAPPPSWMTMLDSLRPGKAFLLGMGMMAIGAKFWVFTLGAVGAISDAQLEVALAVATFVLFVLLTQLVNIAVLAVDVLAPHRSEGLLGAASAWLSTNNRIIMIVLGLVFGSWFLIKSLSGLGIF